MFADLFGWSWMTFGAAMTAGHLLKLDELQLRRAIGQAFVTAPLTFDVLRHTRPNWTDGVPANWHKYQMCGAAAEAGINAALLASYGWVAQIDVLDEGSRFWRSFGAVGCDWDALYDRLGEHWYIADCAIKPYPFCRFGHAALDILTDLVSGNAIVSDDIEEVLVRIPPHELSEALMKLVVVDDPLKLMGSQPTAMALVALGVTPGPKWFETDLTSDAVRSLARRVRYEVEPTWGAIMLEQQNADRCFRRIPTEVTVKTRDGKSYSGFAERALGDPWSPESDMSDARLAKKAHGFLEGILPADRTDALVSAAMGLDGAGNVDALVRAMKAD